LGDRYGCCVRTVCSLPVGLRRKTAAALSCVTRSPRLPRRSLPEHCPARPFYEALLETSRGHRGNCADEVVRGKGKRATPMGDGRCGGFGDKALRRASATPSRATSRQLPGDQPRSLSFSPLDMFVFKIGVANREHDAHNQYHRDITACDDRETNRAPRLFSNSGAVR
jgi:hypothetical protein